MCRDTTQLDVDSRGKRDAGGKGLSRPSSANEAEQARRRRRRVVAQLDRPFFAVDQQDEQTMAAMTLVEMLLCDHMTCNRSERIQRYKSSLAHSMRAFISIEKDVDTVPK